MVEQESRAPFQHCHAVRVQSLGFLELVAGSLEELSVILPGSVETFVSIGEDEGPLRR